MKAQIELLKEWNDYEKQGRVAREFFRDWWRDNLIFKGGTDKGNIDERFGLAYTSSSDFAAMWNTNSEYVYKCMPDYAFRGIAITTENVVVAYLDWLEDDFKFILVPIGKIRG